MRRRTMLVTLAAVMSLGAVAHGGDWPAWRGPTGLGVSDETGMPVEWGPDKNVTWKVPLPDKGNSTPIVWGDRIFLTQATEKGAERWLMCLSRADGSVMWRKSLGYQPGELTHNTSPYCSSSPVTDGKVVIAWHGSAGMVAYDLDGKELWKRDFGVFTHIWGYASSPVIDGERVYASLGPGLRHLFVALNKTTGDIIWQHEMADAQSKEAKQYKGSWSTPIVTQVGGRKQIVLSLPQYVGGFDPADGKLIWKCQGLSDLVYTSALVGSGYIVAMSGFGGPAICLKEPGPNDRGDLTESHRLWRHERNPQRVGSGVIVGEHLFILNEPGAAWCLDLKTGDNRWGRGQRLSGQAWSSMVHADGKLWVNTTAGETIVLRDSTQFEQIAVNKLGELIRASPVFSDGQVFIRTYKHLWCIGERKRAAE